MRRWIALWRSLRHRYHSGLSLIFSFFPAPLQPEGLAGPLRPGFFVFPFRLPLPFLLHFLQDDLPVEPAFVRAEELPFFSCDERFPAGPADPCFRLRKLSREGIPLLPILSMCYTLHKRRCLYVSHKQVSQNTKNHL